VLEVIGTCQQRIFGLAPAERLRRQLAALRADKRTRGLPELVIVARADAVLDEGALLWLFDHPLTVLASLDGEPLGIASSAEEVGRARVLLDRGEPQVRAGQKQFVRKLRRRVEMVAVPLDRADVPALERLLYGNAYKGVTDLVTKYVWPWPAFHATRLCARLGITPNLVTGLGVLLMLIATWLFWRGTFGWGLAAAWAMTFLDTVDGKLARVTASSSRLGNLLDHGTDLLHPPLWWWAVTAGLVRVGVEAEQAWPSFWLVIGTYVLGRVLEEVFKHRFGFNAYIWERFDSRFRTVASRRNILLLILTIGLFSGALVASWVACAFWSAASLAVQCVRFAQAAARARDGEVRPWLA
jgi:phosphatidylglycerophosphate synthase